MQWTIISPRIFAWGSFCSLIAIIILFGLSYCSKISLASLKLQHTDCQQPAIPLKMSAFNPLAIAHQLLTK